MKPNDPPKLDEYIAALQVGDTLKGNVCQCAICGKKFVARRGAKFCSNACRVRSSRQNAAER